MSIDLLLSLLAFCAAGSFTPGPNTIMLLASGVNFGLRPTVPHMAGITIGFTLMVLIVGLGLGAALLAVPELHAALRIVSIVYMLWLAWKLLNAGRPAQTSASDRPLTFFQAAAFQWVNPKAWAIALTASVAFSNPAAPLRSAITIALVFGLVTLPATILWASFGVVVRRLLERPAVLRAFNITMAVLLVASLYPLLRN